MEDKYLELLKRSNYEDLSQAEKEILKDLCTNQLEFDSARYLMIDLALMDKTMSEAPSKDIKSKLDSEFRQVHTNGEGGGWFRFLFPPLKPFVLRPGIQLAMLFVLFLGSYMMLEFIGFSEQTTSVQLAKEEHKASEDLKEVLVDSVINETPVIEKSLELDLSLMDANTKSTAEDGRLFSAFNGNDQLKSDAASTQGSFVGSSLMSRDDLAFKEESILLGEVVVDFEELSEFDTDLKETQFLIPTVAESPDLLENLFVTF